MLAVTMTLFLSTIVYIVGYVILRGSLVANVLALILR